MVDGPHKSGGLLFVRYLVAAGKYKVSGHAWLELDDCGIDVLDLEESIARGVVIKTAKDDQEASLGNKVYSIVGNCSLNWPVYSGGKIVKTEEGYLYFFCTAHF